MSLSIGANKLNPFIPPHSEKMSDGALRDVSELIAWAKKILSQSRAETDMASLALRLNDLGQSRLEFMSETALREAQRTLDGVRQWLRGAAQEAAIGLFSGLYGLPVPAALVRALAKDDAGQAAAPVVHVAVAQISSEMQWARTTQIFATATSSADAAGRLHVAASEQIDAASYALDRLREEIGPLMIFSREDEELVVRRYERRPARDPAFRQTPQDAVAHAAA
jgi:hypothetical protein